MEPNKRDILALFLDDLIDNVYFDLPVWSLCENHTLVTYANLTSSM